MRIEQFFLDGLGHQSYSVADEAEHLAVVVDPRRDVEIYLEAAARDGAKITHVFETHIHNDYVTGARELAARTGATIVASADAALAYDYLPVHDGDRVTSGALTLTALATPGHTPEHMSYVLSASETATPEAVFTGGSMLPGGSGRTDLLGAAQTLTLTRQQYHSLLRLLGALPDAVRVFPTHGAGSFCASGPASGQRSSTIGHERLASPAVHARDVEDFVRTQMAGYGAYPTYYASMRAVNQHGPRVFGAVPEPPALDARAVADLLAAGTPLVDGRHRNAFATAHAHGAINVEIRQDFGTYVGWILPFDAPLLLLVEEEPRRREAVVQLFRIGYEHVRGYLEGGMAAWTAAGLPTEGFAQTDVETLYARWRGGEPLAILDVRRDDEWGEGHIPGTQHIHVGDLPGRMDEVPRDRPVAVICATGFRAETAASLLAPTGREVIAVTGGVPNWIRHGHPVATGEDEPSALPTPDPATHDHP